MTATTFSRQNDAASRAYTTYYWENLLLVVFLFLESKGLWCWLFIAVFVIIYLAFMIYIYFLISV